MQKQQLLYEGKTKRMWQTDDPKLAIAEFSDDAMMYHAKKKQYFEGKGAYCNKINAILMQNLEENNIATHFVSLNDDNSSVVRRAEMIPVEVVVRNYAAGSIVDRLGLPYHSKLRFPVLEFCYKNDQLGDPVINEYHALTLGLCDREEMSFMCYCATRVNKVLNDLMKPLGIVVADFKLEFGRVGTGLVIADEITPNVARFWDENTLNRFDDNGTSPQKEYEVILAKLQGNLQ
ncbi:MAG TPA: phosphoribosylaminoimidazolesuccinocarboxamide synthase [Clostridiales bacterium]|jgi:phosphoribosylaminoimidazole-succinocarboxamide synthase|uniref:phosphoribosylaminoimidazolesuccinocarboxamide synthase n=1 Tax=Candidatus Fimenecus sp. TaxID=3022888 RepID=UPI000ED81E30|nr:phosphoribosylaminoimidazolesuccinocarboxamide synthase [Clostridiales bacterium]